MQHFLSVREFCAKFGVGRTRAYALIAQGKIDAVKNGARTMIVHESALRWAAELPRLPAKERG